MADSRTSLIFMAPTAIGSKAGWAPQASGMGCSVRVQWAGHIVSPRAQLVYLGLSVAAHTQGGNVGRRTRS